MPVPNMILQLQTNPASCMSTEYTPKDLVRFRKELIKVGKYVKDSTNQAFEVTLDTLHYWAKTFHRWVANGNKVPLVPGHDKINNPEMSQGWVTNVFVEGNSLFGVLELLNPELSLVTDVSIAVDAQVIDGRGIKYKSPITHVALCTDPVVPGLKDFETMSLSLSKGVKTMEFLKKLAAALGYKGEPTEEAILLSLDGLEHKLPAKGETKVVAAADAPVVKLVSENRSIKLSGLVKAGFITPAIRDVIAAKYVEKTAVTLELARGDDDGFDLLYDVLTKNTPSGILEEQSSVQSLELANQGAAGDEGLRLQRIDINRRRVAAGLVAIN